LSDDAAINLAAFCTASGRSVQDVLEQALREYFDEKHPAGYGHGV
jgi:hypothetical protein